MIQPGRLLLGLFRLLGPLLIVAGCASTTPVTAPQDASPPRSWSGRFAVTWLTGSMIEEERASGRFDLRVRGSRIELEASSAFGQTIARAVSDQTGSVLETANGETHRAADPEALTERVLGWRVPVSQLPGWLQLASQSNAGPLRFTESDWSVEIATGSSLPAARLTLRWPAGPAIGGETRRVELRLLLDNTSEPAPITQ